MPLRSCQSLVKLQSLFIAKPKLKTVVHHHTWQQERSLDLPILEVFRPIQIHCVESNLASGSIPSVALPSVPFNFRFATISPRTQKLRGVSLLDTCQPPVSIVCGRNYKALSFFTTLTFAID